MGQIKESKSRKFGNKILKLEDVYEIAQILNAEYLKAKSETEYCRITFTVECEDGTSYESSDIDIFSSKSIVNSKKPTNIQLRYTSYDRHDQTIRIRFRKEYDSTWSENSVAVEGFDSNWVNGVMGRIFDRIATIKPQNPKRKLYLNLIHFATSVSIGRILLLIILPLLDKPDESRMGAATLLIRQLTHTNEFTHNLVLYLGSFIIGILPGFVIRSYFEKLWPYLEFQIGPVHELDESRRRGIFIKLITLILIPLILAVLYDVIKYYI